MGLRNELLIFVKTIAPIGVFVLMQLLFQKIWQQRSLLKMVETPRQHV